MIKAGWITGPSPLLFVIGLCTYTTIVMFFADPAHCWKSFKSSAQDTLSVKPLLIPPKGAACLGGWAPWILCGPLPSLFKCLSQNCQPSSGRATNFFIFVESAVICIIPKYLTDTN